MNKTAKIIEKLGGVNKVSHDTHTPYTTVRSWVVSGNIPDRQKKMLIEYGKKNGIEIEAGDFF